MSGDKSIFEHHESAVRAYCRLFPAVFTHAREHLIWDDTGRQFIDFICGAGALNYGHNHPAIKRRIIGYLEGDGIIHGLDFHTAAKRAFIRDLLEIILVPRRLDYKIQFTGPTGTNAVEAAFKLARRATGRTSIVAFTNGFHGMTLGALAATGSLRKRAGAGVSLQNVIRMPYEGYFGPSVDTLAILERLLSDGGSGIERPAAIIVETIQGEGGLGTASSSWLRGLAQLAHRLEILLIVDDIQAGCGRTGNFLSFEEAGINPDIVCLSKSLSGIGLPMALMLYKPAFDCQGPGEHSGTFRGNNLAFVGASAALSLWNEPGFADCIRARASNVDKWLERLSQRDSDCVPRGRGMLRGIAFPDKTVARRVSAAAYELGLLVETSGAEAEVLKITPPLNIEVDALSAGLALLDRAIATVRASN